MADASETAPVVHCAQGRGILRGKSRTREFIPYRPGCLEKVSNRDHSFEDVLGRVDFRRPDRNAFRWLPFHLMNHLEHARVHQVVIIWQSCFLEFFEVDPASQTFFVFLVFHLVLHF